MPLDYLSCFAVVLRYTGRFVYPKSIICLVCDCMQKETNKGVDV